MCPRPFCKHVKTTLVCSSPACRDSKSALVLDRPINRDIKPRLVAHSAGNDSVPFEIQIIDHPRNSLIVHLLFLYLFV